MGHIRDLPSSKLGVNVEDKYSPQYIVPVKARKNLTAIKNALVGKKEVLLATDLDREGEAIAWHIAEVLELAKKDDLVVKRITFDEITEGAIKSAIAHPRDLDMQLVNAQQARRVLDRLVGYSLSPILWRKIYRGLSAGRVQSAALRLIVDREKERDAFRPIEYFTVEANLNAKAGTFSAQLAVYNGKKIEAQGLRDRGEVDKILATLKEAAYSVQSIQRKPLTRKPYPPYTTSTFQQDSVNKLGLSARKAMMVAQRLYEDGFITYMRTDSTDLAQTAVATIRGVVEEVYGKEYLPEKPPVYRSKTQNAQEAHEAIRPTNPARTTVPAGKDPASQKVYDLIRRRAIASQMASARLEQTSVDIVAGPGLFRATGQVVQFPGFLAIWQNEGKEEKLLTPVEEGEVLNLIELKDEQHFTEPPPRYSEATLIKALEEQGIGRPSTYAPTIDTIIKRRYVYLEQKRFVPEQVGKAVIDLLLNHFPEIVDLGFTAEMESRLDRIAEGEANYESTLDDFWKPFQAKIDTSQEGIEKVDLSEETDQVCPNCGAPMLIKMGRFGKFLACSKFPECKTTQPLTQAQPTGLICPLCGKELAQRRSRRGFFFGCTGYPDCKFAVWKREQLPSKIEDLAKEGIEMPFREKALEAYNTASHPETNE
jgi:DNA topoisomerase-1